MQHGLVSTYREPKQKWGVLKIHTGQIRSRAPGHQSLPSQSLTLPCHTHWPCEVHCPLVRFISEQLFPPMVQAHHFLPSHTQCGMIHTQKSRQLQTYSPSCVSGGISTNQAPAQILYKKFPLLSKNSRPLWTTLLLKFWSPGSCAFNSSSFLAVGNPSPSARLEPARSLVEHFCSSCP